MVFHWSLSDSKSPQVSRTLLSILAVLNNAVVWMVSTRPPTSKSSSPFSYPLVTVPNAPITIGIIVTCMFHSFFNSLARSRYLSFFSHSFSFILWSAGTAKSTILQVLFCCLLSLVFWPRLDSTLKKSTTAFVLLSVYQPKYTKCLTILKKQTILCICDPLCPMMMAYKGVQKLLRKIWGIYEPIYT